MNYLGIDWGSQRVGLAVGNDQAKLARLLPSLPNDSRLLKVLKSLCTDEQIDQIIIGRPRNLEGRTTPQSQQIAEWANELKANLRLPIRWQDESLTTVATGKAEKDVDSAAAAIILQDYLDAKKDNSR